MSGPFSLLRMQLQPPRCPHAARLLPPCWPWNRREEGRALSTVTVSVNHVA